MAKKYKTGLVLSGGGTRGFAHLGVIAALYEKGINPDVISGSSVGAVVGAFIANGQKPEEVLQIFKKGSIFKYTKLHLPVDGLVKLDGLKEVIEKNIPVKNIEELHIPLYIAVSNLNKGTVEYLSRGPIGEAALASSSIPLLFSPVKINGNLYVDGGLMDNIPIEPVKNDCEQIIVCNINPINPTDRLKNMLQIASRTFYMSVNVNMKEIGDYATLFIEPAGINKYDILSISHADELFELGYTSTLKALEKNSLLK